MKYFTQVKVNNKIVRSVEIFPKEIICVNSNVKNFIKDNGGLNNIHSLIFKPIIIHIYTLDGKVYENSDTIKSITLLKSRPNQIIPDLMFSTTQFNIKFTGNGQKVFVETDAEFALFCFNFLTQNQEIPPNHVVNKFIKKFNKEG